MPFVAPLLRLPLQLIATKLKRVALASHYARMLQRRFRILAAKREYSRRALEKENQFVHGEATLMQAGVRQLVKKRAYKRCVARALSLSLSLSLSLPHAVSHSAALSRPPPLSRPLSPTLSRTRHTLCPALATLPDTSSTGSALRARQTSARCFVASNAAR